MSAKCPHCGQAMPGDGDGFDAFWAAYPKKRSKGQARRAWTKLRPDAALQVRILAAIGRAVASLEWTRDGGQYIPHPATWLNAEGWEDEPTRLPVLAPAAPRSKTLDAVDALQGLLDDY